MTHQAVWLDCEHPGCPNGITADATHLASITSPGGWDCGNHHEGTTDAA